MASKKTINTIKKTTRKAAKKNPKGFLVLLIFILVIAAGFGIFIYIKNKQANTKLSINGPEVYSISLNSQYDEKGASAFYKGKDISKEIVINYYIDSKNGSEVNSISTVEERTFFVKYSINHEDFSDSKYRQVIVSDTDPLEINFIDLENSHTGDCTYIKAGTTDILIDAGSIESSAERITAFLNEPGRGDDGKIEYLIATHSHKDHIAGFVGTSKIPGIFDAFQVENIIQFSQTSAVENGTNLYSKFLTKVNEEVNNGAHLLYPNTLISNNKNVIEVGKNITMTILDQKYYYEVSSDENNHSVCTLFTQGNNNFLFTGDLEKNGEESLVELNQNLPHVNLFKAGHHGSYTASNDCLLSKITPDVICVCCCAGNDEYTKDVAHQFPAQEFIDRIAKYTSEVYVTTLTSTNEQANQPFNGTITIKSTTNGMTISCSNNNKFLKDTDWFKANRTCPPEWQ